MGMDGATSPRRRRLRTGIFYLGCVLMLLVARVSWSGHGALESGKVALAAGEELSARVLLREAVSWYLPGASWRQEAAGLLWELHERQVEQGALGEAAATLQACRAGFMAAQSIVAVDREWIERINTRLVPLMVQWEAAAAESDGREITRPEEERVAWMASRLSADSRPNRVWSLAMVFGFALWVGSSVSATRRGGQRRLLELVAAVCGLLVFCLGVALA